ncbi:MAG: hypothetical protein IKT07_10415 [Oscillospiraceae bacterium]|nr:hypothetical protein [Oscillospiraceae bacterium]
MSTGQRFTHVLTGLAMIALGVLMMLEPEDCVVIAAGLLSISLTVRGIRYLVYYFTMARHMVGGKLMLYVSIISLDLGLFTATLLDTPRFYIFLYLIAAYAFSGVINLLRGLEARNYGGAAWKHSIIHGGVCILIALASVVFIRSADVLVVFYSAGLIYSALIRIATAFRRTAIVYIQ